MENRTPRPVSGPSINLAVSLALFLAAVTAQAQSVLLETWTGITGTAVTNLTSNANYPNTPNTRSNPTIFEIATNAADNYGTRIRAFVTAPTTGNYIFWIAGDDDCELWLGTTDNASSAVRIATVTGWTNSREWTKFPSQQSTPIALTAGQRYYIETRHKEGTGGDNLAVGWQLPSGTQERPIPGSRLQPFIHNITVPAITTQPANRTVTLGQTAAFSVVATGTGLSYQWRRNGVDVTSGTGGTTANYTTAATVSDDNNAVYSVVVRNGAGSVTSGNATLTVNAAPTAPAITTQPVSQTVTAPGTATFSVVATGTAPLTYQWRRNGVNVTNGTGGTTATYTTAPTTTSDNGAVYTVVVTNSVSSVTSGNATLTVNSGSGSPVLAPLTTPVNAVLGATATFTVSVTGGTSPFTYQWRRNGVNVTTGTGGTTASYTTPPTTLADNGAVYTCAVTNGAGSATSTGATLNIELVTSRVTATRITATEVVTTPFWEIPDYVFEKGYALRTLPELEQFLATHKHLPEVPSAAEIKARGMNMGEMNVKLLKNLEELTLHMIALQKEMKAKDSRFERQLDSLRTLLKTR